MNIEAEKCLSKTTEEQGTAESYLKSYRLGKLKSRELLFKASPGK
jgi:hypothetical protein